MLKESIATFREPVYVRVQRSAETYRATADYVQINLARLAEAYRMTENDQQTLRLIRDDIDTALRRYHGYCIKENITAHYIDPDVDDNGIFEHMIPASTVRDMLLHRIISPAQACNPPTCKLSKDKDILLRQAGWNSKTPDIYNFWERYNYSFETVNKFETYDGTPILTTSWTLDNHFDYFG